MAPTEVGITAIMRSGNTPHAEPIRSVSENEAVNTQPLVDRHCVTGPLPPFKEEVQTEDAQRETQKYQIERHSDGPVITKWEDADETSTTLDSRTTNDMIANDVCGKFQPDLGYIDLAHYGGETFTIPWALGRKWVWMKDAIKLTYGSDETAKQSVEDGKFVLRNGERRILPEFWDRVVGNWNRIEIRLSHQKRAYTPYNFEIHPHPDPVYDTDKEETHQELEDIKTEYQSIVQYKYEFFNRENYQNRSILLGSRAYDYPLSLEKRDSSKGKVAILEEINGIEFGSQRNTLPTSDHLKNDWTIGAEDKVRPKKLIVNSQLILNALRSIVKYSSYTPPSDPYMQSNDDNPDGLGKGVFAFPFKELYHHAEDLLNLRNETTGARANHTPEYNYECDQHIDMLVRYLEDEPVVQIKSAKEKWAQKVPTTTFASFWLLMKPGSDVYVREHGQLNAYVVKEVRGGVNYSALNRSTRNYSIGIWHLVFNGVTITRSSKTIEVLEYDGEREITSLSVFPTKFQDRIDGGSLRRHLIERGNKFFRFTQAPNFLEYTGLGLRPGWKKYRRARVVVEHQSLPWKLFKSGLPSSYWYSLDQDSSDGMEPPGTYPHARLPMPPGYPGITNLGHEARAPRCECLRCRDMDRRNGTHIVPIFHDYDSISPFRKGGLSEHQALICMSHMFGFVLKDRAYDILDLNHLSEPTFADNSIDQLVLRPEKNKDVIKAIARTYTESDSQEDLFSVDFIRGKGEGQIFLLHGPPGTGKTLTAESVAEYTKRPLLSITAADLGHEPELLEANLLRFFKNATTWDAIVLLDEADVYLERRSADNLKRNSIVSVFLRALDYFEGILFLTTNRVGQFDEAFLSRIHVAIGYDSLDEEARSQVWKTFFNKLESNRTNGGPTMTYQWAAKEYVLASKEVKDLRWNGREIRNAFQTAVALAMDESKAAKAKGRPITECIPRLTEAHLRQVVGMSAAFRQYIKTTHEGLEESERAYIYGNRYDGMVEEGK